MPSLSRGPARVVAHEIVRHGEHPCPLVHDRLLAQRTHERLLRDFLRPVAVTEPARQVAHQHRVILTEETFGVVHARYQFLTASARVAASSFSSPSGATSITTRLPCTRTRSPIANSGASSGML